LQTSKTPLEPYSESTMKRANWILSIIVAVALSNAAAYAKTIKFTPRMNKGDRFVLEIVKGQTQSGRPEMGRTRGFQAVDVEILSVDKNIALGWTAKNSGAVDPTGKPIKLPDQAAAMTTIFDGVQMIFELSPEYKLIGLKNLDQIKPVMTKVFEKTLAAIKRSDEDKAQLRKAMMSMLSSRKTIEQMCSQQVTLLLGLSQVELQGKLEDKPQAQTEGSLPVPFGEGVIAAKTTTKVTQVDRTAQKATVTVTTALDPKQAAKAMLAAIQAMARKMNKPPPTAKDIPSVDIKDACMYVVDLKTNMPLSVDHTRTTTIGQKVRTDTIKITRKLVKANSPQRQ
jgi:hypothetical protein